MRTRLAVRCGILPFSALFPLLGLVGGCAGDDDPPASPNGMQPVGTVVAASDCGGFGSMGPDPRQRPTKDCIEYDYDGLSTLALRHVNAGFNCGPYGFPIEVRVQGNVITVDELGVDGDADCNCLFDVDLEVVDLPPGTYEVRVLEPILRFGAAPLEFGLDLSEPVTGRYCVHRDFYPWGT
jgi:hypothetical protein